MDWTPDEIRRRRDEHGLSQDELARALNEHGGRASRRALSNWENGTAIPHGRNLRALDQVLGAQATADDPPLSKATFMQTLAHLAHLYAQAGAQTDVTSGSTRYKIFTEDIDDPSYTEHSGLGETGEPHRRML